VRTGAARKPRAGPGGRSDARPGPDAPPPAPQYVLQAMSPVPLADLVEERSGEILRRWSDAVVVTLGERLPHAQLVDHVPGLLRSIAASLRAGRVVDAAGQNGEEHGEQRHRVGIDLDQLLREHAVLRRVVLELAEETGTPVTPRQAALAGDVLAEALARSVTEFVRAREEALRESEERFRTIFTNMTEGFALGEAICDEAGTPRDFRLIEMNDAFERQSGLRREDVRGRPITQVLPHVEPSWIRIYGGVAVGGEPVRFENYNHDLDRHFDVYCYRPAPGRFAILFTDVTKRRRAEEALRDSEARFRALAEAMPQMVWTTDAEGRLEYLNSRWLAYTGAARDAPLESAWSAIHPEDLPRARARWDEAHRTGTPYEEEHRLRRFDGAYRWHLARGVPVRAVGGAVLRWFGTTTDVDDLKRLQEALSEADRRKGEFLGVLSHELRNPLAPIRTAVSLLERAPTGTGAPARTLAILRRQTDHLTRLVDDLLDVTRISRGKIELRRARVDVADVVRQVAEDHRPLVEEHGTLLRVDAGEAVWVEGDPTRLAQIVGNVLQNATKFTPSGGEVALSARRVGDAAEIRVRDTGAGMEPSRIASMFEPFTQGEQSLARLGGGLGLGLALVKGLAEAHGGTVEARSDGPGSGTEVVVRLPLSSDAAVDGGGAAGPAGTQRRLHVLVVDDNRDAAESLAELVGLLGHDASVAYDGPTAVARARERPPDVVLCDLGLPGMSGYEVARALRGEGGHARLVAVSGYARPEDVARSAEAGFERHLAKPASPDELERLLR
jgi:PAS domain S-box-containing protein